MFSIGVRLIWLVITSMALSYGSYIVVVRSVLADESGATKPVELIDLLRPGVHYISGMVTVPNACDELTVHVVNTLEFTYDLQFDMWEEPSIHCSQDPVPRHFSTVAFAPAAGVHFTAEMNKIPFNIVMKQRVISKQAVSEIDAAEVGQ